MFNILNPRRFLNTPMFNGAAQEQDTSVAPSNESVNVTAPAPTGKPYLDQYINALGQEPTREQYKPGLMQKILASVAGFATGYNGNGAGDAINTSKALLDNGYNTAHGDWKNHLGLYKEKADLERQGIMDMLDINKDTREGKALDNSTREIDDRIADSKDARRFRGLFQSTDRNTGHLNVFNLADPTYKSDLGKIDLTPQEENDSFIKRYQRQAGIDNTNRLGQIAATGAQDRLNRQNDAANPIPLQINPFVNPTQIDAADSQAVEDVLRAHPYYGQFTTKNDKTGRVNGIGFTDGGSWSQGSAKDNYDLFVKRIQARKDELLNTRRGGTNNIFGDKPRAPQSPLNPPSNDARAKAIADIKAEYPNRPDLLTNEDYIKQVMGSK